MIDTTYIIYVIIRWVCSACLCAYIASQKNRDNVGWFFSGLVFGVFAVIAIVAVPVIEKQDEDAEDYTTTGETLLGSVRQAMQERSTRKDGDKHRG